MQQHQKVGIGAIWAREVLEPFMQRGGQAPYCDRRFDPRHSRRRRGGACMDVLLGGRRSEVCHCSVEGSQQPSRRRTLALGSGTGSGRPSSCLACCHDNPCRRDQLSRTHGAATVLSGAIACFVTGLAWALAALQQRSSVPKAGFGVCGVVGYCLACERTGARPPAQSQTRLRGVGARRHVDVTRALVACACLGRGDGLAVRLKGTAELPSSERSVSFRLVCRCHDRWHT